MPAVLTRVEDLAVPWVPSDKIPCTSCAKECWISTSTRAEMEAEMAKYGDDQFLCVQCAFSRMEEEGNLEKMAESLIKSIREPLPGVRAELAQFDDYDPALAERGAVADMMYKGHLKLAGAALSLGDAEVPVEVTDLEAPVKAAEGTDDKSQQDDHDHHDQHGDQEAK